ncbi:MAG TPA: VCBS repeat-containing protein, partial [Anaerolineales bacterium]|nr:VCBS repeat-containing protein [Anaerolineales bacterium]
VDNVGAVMVFRGSEAGVSLLNETYWRQGENSVQETPEETDSFGIVLAAGDFDGNGIGDLAVGVPGEDVDDGGGDQTDAGVFHILYGSAIGGGLSGANDQVFTQGLDGILGLPETLDRFANALIAADFNGDGADDLAVGVPFQDGTESNQGFVQVFYSNGAMLFTDGQQLWTQGLVEGVPETDDYFGFSVTAGDYDGDGFADLVAGVPFEDAMVEAVLQVDAGALNVIYGAGSGLSADGNQIWYQETTDIPDIAEANDRFALMLGR